MKLKTFLVATVLLAISLLSCSARDQKIVAEGTVAVAKAECLAQLPEEYATICDLSEVVIDALVKKFLATPSGATLAAGRDPAKMPLVEKQRLVAAMCSAQ